MGEFQDYLAILDSDPGNDQALAALEQLGPQLSTDEAATALQATRKQLVERGQLEAVERLFDVELGVVEDVARRAELLLQKGCLYVDELLDEKSALECFERVLELRPEHEDAQELLEHLGLVRENWRKIVQKYLDEAESSTDRELTTSLYLSAAETFARYEPDAPEVDSYLRRALEVDPSNRRATHHLKRLLYGADNWTELRAVLEQQVEQAASNDDRVQALLELADLALARLEQPDLATDCMKRVIALEPANPRALRFLSDQYEADENWSALVMLYTSALKVRRRGSSHAEVGTLLQIAMLHWRRLGNLEAAEEYFRRIRKLKPEHPAALEFYREYHRAQGGDPNQLLQVYRAALKAVPEDDAARRRELAVDIAKVAEFDAANPDKAIDAWKLILRGDPDASDARDALKRLYAKTEKWNALLDLMKEDVDRRPKDDVEGRIQGLLEIVEIYRDRIHLEVMVINTYNAILALDASNVVALDALADRYKQRGQWNDLITVLSRKAAIEAVDTQTRVALLREVASLWIERFGNFAQAINPLEQIIELQPGDASSISSLKEIYGRRRQWRALVALLGREAAVVEPMARRPILGEMANLAAERLGDAKLAIEIWNRVLELGDPGELQSRPSPIEALVSLASLYEREKRYVALAEVMRRQLEFLGDDPAASVSLLERLGALLSDKLRAPSKAAQVYSDLLAIDPNHGKAARTLRELYAATGDYQSLEKVYAELGQWHELVEALVAIADRQDDRDLKLTLCLRAAELASQHLSSVDKIARAWERVLAIEPHHVEAARALAPIYEKAGKSARLLATYEILLENAADDDARLALMLEICELCESRLGSKSLAFQWAARAYRLRPDDPKLLVELERIGADADAWDEVAEVLDERAKKDDVTKVERLRLLRELGKISSQRLHEAERAQTYWERVLELEPDDREALAAIEEIATHQADWPDLLKIYRRKIDLDDDTERRLDLLFKVAFIEEERLSDRDAAAKTYRAALELDPTSRRAHKALIRLAELKGDDAELSQALEAELAQTPEPESRFALLMRLGELYQSKLDSPSKALERFKDALSLAPGVQVHRAIEELWTHKGSSDDDKLEIARILLPVFEQADDVDKQIPAIETIRAASESEQAIEYDRPAGFFVSSGRPERKGLRLVAASVRESSRGRRELCGLAFAGRGDRQAD